MPTRRERNPNKPLIARIILVMFAWVLYIVIALSFVSFVPADRSHMTTINGAPHPHNWCNVFGATIAYWGMYRIGKGIYIGLVFLGLALVAWTRGVRINQTALRVIGVALLVASVSTLFNMAGGAGPWGEGDGGILGIALGDFMLGKFGVGAWFLVPATFIVGALLAADEFVLAIPHVLLHVGKKFPTEPVAAVATGAAGGMWSGICNWFESFTTRRHMGPVGKRVAIPEPKINSSRKKKDAPAEALPAEQPDPVSRRRSGDVPDELTSDPAPATEPQSKPIENRKSKIENPPAPAPVAEVDKEESAELDVPVRKPAAPKGPTLPFRPVVQPQKTQDFGNYRLPGLDLLDEAEPIDTVGQEQRVREKAKVLEAALESFNIDGKVEAIDTGPVVTLFELNLAPGVKSSQVAALSKDIARALKSPPVRIIDNIPGKSTMGIEVPNLDRERVRLKELFQIGNDRIAKMALPMCIGKDASGNPLIEDLTKIPHLLIAGTTGSGKSVCINSIIMTILLTQRPDHVKLILVDPKMVEMQDYKSIPHLMAPIIDDMSKAESILEWATQKMDERYETMSEANVRHIKDYNKLTKLEIIERFNATTGALVDSFALGRDGWSFNLGPGNVIYDSSDSDNTNGGFIDRIGIKAVRNRMAPVRTFSTRLGTSAGDLRFRPFAYQI